MIYVTDTASILEEESSRAALLDWISRNRFNAASLYGIREALAQPDHLGRFMRELRSHGIQELDAVVPRSERLGAILRYQDERRRAERFTGINFEHEYWNPGTRLGNVVWDSEQMALLRRLTLAHELELSRYVGAGALSLSYAKAIMRATDSILLHCYVPSRSFPTDAYAYVEQRLRTLERAARQEGRRYSVRIIFSAEPRYMSAYLHSHSFDSAYRRLLRLAPAFRALRLDGYAIYNSALAMEASP